MALEDLKAEREAASSEAPPKRGRGRPPGTKNKPREEEPAEEGGLTPEALDAMLDASLRELGNLPVVVFNLPPPLTDAEKAQFAGATKPVLLKHLGDLLTSFGPELVCCVTVYAIFWPRYVHRKRQENSDRRDDGKRKDGPGEAASPGLPAPSSP